jgi:hypothetical protein
MQRHALKTSDSERRKPVLVLEPTELSLDGGAAPVEVAPAPSLAWNERVAAVGLDPLRLGLTLPGRAAPLGSPALEIGPRKRPAAMLAARRGGVREDTDSSQTRYQQGLARFANLS